MIDRKKAIVLLSALEMFLLAFVATLFLTDAVGLYVFLALVILIASVTATLLVIIIRKYPS
ncbi:MAG: hypothetical protein IJ144_06435 [Prevotella sp.]|nr:hypothetical protein [Prevotella sp.]MBQ9187440.1 hypothetical protein [Prevotella sp.]